MTSRQTDSPVPKKRVEKRSRSLCDHVSEGVVASHLVYTSSAHFQATLLHALVAVQALDSNPSTKQPLSGSKRRGGIVVRLAEVVILRKQKTHFHSSVGQELSA